MKLTKKLEIMPGSNKGDSSQKASAAHQINTSVFIHEDSEFRDEQAHYQTIKGIDTEIPNEIKEIINDPNYFKELSLSFYAKKKNQSASPTRSTQNRRDSLFQPSATKSEPFNKFLELPKKHSVSKLSELSKLLKFIKKENLTREIMDVRKNSANPIRKSNFDSVLHTAPDEYQLQNSDSLKAFQIRKTNIPIKANMSHNDKELSTNRSKKRETPIYLNTSPGRTQEEDTIIIHDTMEESEFKPYQMGNFLAYKVKVPSTNRLPSGLKNSNSNLRLAFEKAARTSQVKRPSVNQERDYSPYTKALMPYTISNENLMPRHGSALPSQRKAGSTKPMRPHNPKYEPKMRESRYMTPSKRSEI